MSANCCNHTPEDQLRDGRYRRVLWAVLVINAAMFLVEIIAGLAAVRHRCRRMRSIFMADAANYGISLFVLGMALRYRASAALAKGVTMGLFGCGCWPRLSRMRPPIGTVPGAATMGVGRRLWRFS